MENKDTKKLVKTRQGVVLRKSGDMTIVVEVSSEKRHKVYGKKIKTSKRFLVHDSNNTAVIGDAVSIKECRPYSKRKRWTLTGGKTETAVVKKTSVKKAKA
jgi:small subunit ribosomal protein S17